MLSPGELASMRAEAEKTMAESCQIGRRAEVADGGGGKTVTWPTVATVKCGRAPLGQQGSGEHTQGDRVTPEAEWIMTLPHGTDVRTADRLTIGVAAYEVVAVRGARTWELTRRVECKVIG
jgi:head-tail adaptor